MPRAARSGIAEQIPHEAAELSRRLRNPVHSFQLRHEPFQIQPFLLAPVLPGETLKNLNLQARCVTKPIKSAFIGWWHEMYLFYVKHRDMTDSATFQAMVMDTSAVVTGASVYRTAVAAETAGAKEFNFHSGTGIDWALACYQPVVRDYFRDEGEAWNTHQLDSVSMAQISGNGIFDSAILDSALTTAMEVNVAVSGGGTIAHVSEIERALETYRLLMEGGLINMGYEDFLRSYGVRSPEPTKNSPELVRYVRNWTYPSAHIDPTNGNATAAASWSVAERADKARFFPEPGFIFGVTVVRPKVYFSKQKQSAANLMDDMRTWLPSVLTNKPMASFKKITDGANDILAGNASADFWVDVKDLLVYGDQFVNFTLAATDAGLVALPDASLGHRYADEASIDALFVSATAVDGVTQDGVARLSILGTQMDTSPRGSTFGVIA
jgi:hypothetical protein